MLTFITRMFRDKYKSLIIYCLSAVLFLEMFVAMFPMMNEMSEYFDQMLQTMPAELFKAFNLDQASMSLSSLESFLSMEHFSMIWPILAIIFTISIGNYLIANDVENGTAESLMSLPVKRSKIFISRYIAGLLMLIIFNAVSIFSAILLAAIHNIDFLWQNYLTLFFGSVLFSAACLSLVVFISNLINEKGKSTMLSGGLFMLSYVIMVLANLKDSFENLKYFSIFNYFNGETLLIKNTYPEYIFLALGGLFVVLSILAFFRFKSRDISS